MEFSAYLEINSATQGTIEGDSGHSDYPNAIRVFDFKHDISVPVAVASNHSNVRAEVVHAPIIINKEIDKSTPKLYQSLVQREMLDTAEFTFLRYNSNGGEQPYYRVKLIEAMIVKIEPWSPSDSQGHLRFMEKVHLVYRNISWSWGESESVIYETNWRAD